jgi:hypothetical protein
MGLKIKKLRAIDIKKIGDLIIFKIINLQWQRQIKSHNSRFININNVGIEHENNTAILIDDIAPRWAGKRQNSKGVNTPARVRSSTVQNHSSKISNDKSIHINVGTIKRFHNFFKKNGIEGLLPKYSKRTSNDYQG